MSGYVSPSASSSSVVTTLCPAARRISSSTLGPPYFEVFVLAGPTPLMVTENALRVCVGLRQTAQVVRQSLRRELVGREADALAARSIQEDHVGGVLEIAFLRADAELGPDLLQGRPGAKQEAHPAGQVVAAEERPGAVGRVVGGVDADGVGRDVVAQLVQRAANGAGGDRAGVLAVGVQERDDARPR